jgi:hypothetical protein
MTINGGYAVPKEEDSDRKRFELNEERVNQLSNIV